MPFEGAKVILNPFTGQLDVVSENSNQLHFGAERLGTSPTTRYLYPGYAGSLAEIVFHEIVSPRAGTLRNLEIIHNVPGGGLTVITYTVEVQGVSSALAVGMAANASFGANSTNTASVSKGDRIRVAVTRAANVSSPRNVHATMEIV